MCFPIEKQTGSETETLLMNSSGSGSGSAPPAAFQPPASVSIMSPLTSSRSRRRLSSNFIPYTEPIRADRQLTWVSTRLGESSSAKQMDNGVAWELFGPIALLHAASANLKKNKLISQLQESVQLRDLVLAAMQEELDNLCDQVNYFKDQPDTMCCISSTINADDSIPGKNIKSVGCGCHQSSPNDPMGNAVMEESNCEDTFNFQLPLMNVMTSEERRISNVSDWAPSVISSVDFKLQLDTEQDIYNLRMECEEKDTTIKDLSVNLHSSEVKSSKRITELEGIIRKKKSAITKLNKDMAVLEQKVSYLTRLRRPSSLSSSNASVKQLRAMVDNCVYDVDSATSPSSSDLDISFRTSSQAPNAKSEIIVQNCKKSLAGDQKSRHDKSLNIVDKLTNRHQNSLLESPVKKNSPNEKSETESLSRLRRPTRSKVAIL